jgi:DNA polymerase I
LLAEHRDHGKLRSKTREINALVQASGDGRTHPQLNALKARTGRMSISRPALQNLPKKDQRVRAALLAEDGHVLVGADFSQVEYRVAAALSGDTNMTEAITAGRDLHDHTATAIFGPGFTEEQRQTAKIVGFSVLYGAGATRVAGTIGQTEQYAQDIIDRFFAAYPSLKRYINKTKRDPLIVSMSGRRTSVHPDKAFASTNYHIQGTARDIFAGALLRLRATGWGDALWLVIHDEIILQVRQDQAEAARAALEAAMTTTFAGVPITAEAQVLGRRWGQVPEPTAD